MLLSYLLFVLILGVVFQVQLLRNTGGERPRRPHDEESSLPMHLIRPISASLMSQPSSGFRADASASTAKFDRAIQMNVGQTWQYPPRSTQVVPFGHPSLSNKLRDSNLPPSVLSQGAADEGSRTGIKGSGILNSVNTSAGFSDRLTSGVLLCNSKQKSHSEPESSAAPRYVFRKGIVIFCITPLIYIYIYIFVLLIRFLWYFVTADKELHLRLVVK